MIPIEFKSDFDYSLSYPDFVYQVLISVQTRKKIFSLLKLHRDFQGDQSLKDFLHYFNSSRNYAVSSLFPDRYISRYSPFLNPDFRLRHIFTDYFNRSLVFLSSMGLDNYHELIVSWLSSVVSLYSIPFIRSPADSRYSGADLELANLFVEFESGLKASYRGLENRIILYRSPVVIVVPNERVKKRYMTHFKLWNIDIVSLLEFPRFLQKL